MKNAYINVESNKICFMKFLYIKKLKLILFIFLLGLNLSSSADVTKLTLIDTNGVERAMSDYIGQETWVLVNVWSPTCSFCVQELPKISLFKKSNPEVPVIAVTLDYPSFEYGRIDIIKTFLKKYPQDYPMFLADIGQVSDLIGMRLVGIPLVALFNPEGKPVARWPGEIEIDEILKRIMTRSHQNLIKN
jgi:thiol-disulfide isomerase/thioredoxin